MPFPFLLSMTQFSLSACLSFGLINIFCQFPDLHDVFFPGSAPPDPHAPLFRKVAFIKILPLGLLQSMGKYFSLCATQLVPLATVASTKALSPLLMVIGYRVLYKVKLSALTYALLIPLLGGVLIIILVDAQENNSGVHGLLSFTSLEPDHLKGLVFCIIGVFLMVTQQIYGKELVTWDPNLSIKHNSMEMGLNSNPETLTMPSSLPMSAKNSSTLPLSEKSKYGFFMNSNQSNSKLFTRRTSVSRLPYSSSDVNLSDIGPPRNAYQAQVEEANAAVNPFASFSISSGTAKPDKLTVIFYIALIGLFTSFAGFVTRESQDLFASIPSALTTLSGLYDKGEFMKVASVTFLISLCHFGQTLLSFLLLGSISAISFSIASMMKRIVIIVVSILLVRPADNGWFGRMSSSQMQGLGLIAIGLYSYGQWGSKSTHRD